MADATDIISLEQAGTLPALLRERVRRSPESVAYVHHDAAGDRWLETTWRQMAAETARWQAGLRREALRPGDRVALMLRNCREWVCFDMAAAGLGLITVPLYTNDRPENIRNILREADVKLLLLETAEQWRTLQAAVQDLDGLARILIQQAQSAAAGDGRAVTLARWLPAQGGEFEVGEVASDSLATIVYTSGTTGNPKGVMLSHRNLLWNVQASLRTTEVYPADRFLSFLPLSHALERTGGYYLPMAAGASVAYCRSVAQLGEDLQRIRPTILMAVPRIFERVYARIQEKLAGESELARRLFAAAVAVGWRRFERQQGRAAWSPALLGWPLLDRLVGAKIRARLGGRLRIAVCGGAPLAPDIARFFLALGVPLIQGYGLTEASPVVSVNTPQDNIPDSVGLSLPQVEVRIGDQNELLTRSPSVMLGYWEQPAATARLIDPDGWLHTGDQVRMQRGHIFITGRLKDVIVLANGEKVPPSDMEMNIALDELFSQVLIIGEGRPYLAALVVLEADAYARLAAAHGLEPELSAERLNPRLEELLLARVSDQLRSFPGYARVRRIALVEEPWTIEEGMMTPTMKLRRARILSGYQAEVERLYQGHA